MSGLAEYKSARGAVPQSIDELEEAFVRVHALWLRSPGGGQWPFAGDGPWHLAQAEVGDIKGDWSETLVQTDSGKVMQVRKVESRAPRAPLDAHEVSERDRVTGWLGLVGDEQLRKAVWLASEALHRGEGRVPWSGIARWIGWARSPNALKGRYRLALGEVLCSLNAWPSRRARLLAASA